MDMPIYQVDAFTDRAFAGNPAGVMPLERWLPEATMQNIAAEMNLPETAFFAPEGEHYRIRWFTPTVEMPLCGHATLASAHVLTRFLKPGLAEVRFESLSGPLFVAQKGDKLELDFPVRQVAPKPEMLSAVAKCFDLKPVEVHESFTYIALLETAEQVANLTPDFRALEALDRDVVVTAPGRDGIDFASRFFAPKIGIPEDPVTGAIHCALAPFWAKILS